MADTSNRQLAHATAWAAIWALLATVAGRAVSLIGLVLLARLLLPADFGLVAFALVYVTYAEAVSDLGTTTALIYWPSRRDEVAWVTFVVSFAVGWLWFGLTLLLAPAVASFFQHDSAEPILLALAWVFPIKALGSTHDALLQKELSFRARLVPEVGLAVGKALVAVVLAQVGFGVWSLVWGQLGGVATWTVLLWMIVPWRPRWRGPVDLFRPVLSYGRRVMAVNLLAATLHHADLVVVGRMLGAAALGFYQMAYKLPEVAITMLVRAASKVLFPAFSKMHGDRKRLGEAYLAALHYIALLTLPAAVGLALVAQPLVVTLFGPGWEPTIPILKAMAIYVGLRALGSHAGDVLKAAGRPGLLAALGVVKALLLIPTLIFAASRGPVAVAVAMASVTTVTMVLNIVAVSRLTHLSARDVLGALRASVASVVVLAAVVLAWGQIASAYPPVVHLTGAVLLAVGGYGLSLRVFSPDIFRLATACLGWKETSSPGADEGRLALVNSR